MSKAIQNERGWSVPLWLSIAISLLLFAVSMNSCFAKPYGNFFDDSLMFYRYSMNMRHGLGISWNLDGIHTYGCTSLTWLAVIWLFSFLPLMPIKLVILASLLTWFAALAVLVVWLQRHAASSFLRSPGNALLCIALPLELNMGLQHVAVSGMDTMLSLLCHVLIALCALRFVRNQTAVNALLCAVVAFLAYETRPENILCGILVPCLLWLLTKQGRKFVPLALLLGAEAALMGLAALAAHWYFHSYVPLAFYLKSKHGYLGFIGYHGPTEYLVYFFGYIAVFLGVVILLARRQDRPMLVAFGLPTALTVFYLCTVTQIMGTWGRYFLPFVAYAVIAALLVLDRALAGEETIPVRALGPRAALVTLLVTAGFFSGGGDLSYRIAGKFEAATHHPVPLPKVVMDAPTHETPLLPAMGNLPMMKAMVDDIASKLPAGSSMAATEVGYLGAFAPQISVIDIAGLNDSQFAATGFSMEKLLNRRPDIIWLPHSDYTGMVSSVLSDPHFLEQYDYYAGAYNFGLAIRKDSPSYAVITQALQQAWPTHYPGLPMQDYKVKAIVPVAKPATS